MENDSILDAYKLLATDLAAHPDDSRLVVMPPNCDEFMTGNRGGFVRLAMACLLAAQGMDQEFKDESWVSDWEMDWGVKGLRYDSTPDPEPPPKPSKLRSFTLDMVKYGVLFAVIGIFLAGLLSIAHSLASLFNH